MKKLSYICFAALLMMSCSKADDVTSDTTPTDPTNPTTPTTKNGFTDTQLQSITTGFNTRRDQAFAKMKGTALVRAAIQPCISNTGVQYYRDYSYSLVDFACNCFWNNEQNQAANDALLENCNTYLDHQDRLRDGDSFYWSADELCRIVEFWGSKGTKKAGLLNATTEAAIYKVMWQWASDQSKLKVSKQLNSYYWVMCANLSNVWNIEGTENHGLQRIATRWQFSKLLKDNPTYSSLKYDDGYTAAEHYDGWNAFAKLYLKEHAKKGMFIEFANDAYGMVSLKNVYNFYDFGDAELKKIAGKFLDLFWATWAQEELKGIRGGSKARVYQGRETIIGDTQFSRLAWYYLNIGSLSSANVKQNTFTFISSDYRMPFVDMDIALDASGKGNYEVTQRRLGLVKTTANGFWPMNTTDGLVRYSYCTPKFIMGSIHCPSLAQDKWAGISCQNRWMGVIFPDDPDARIVAQCQPSPTTQKYIYNQDWAVQSKGAMIVQRLTQNKYAGNLRVWVSDMGMKTPVEKDGWIFASTSNGTAYTAIKFIGGSYTVETVNELYNGNTIWSGHWYKEVTANTPVLIETDLAKNYSSFTDFQTKVMALELSESSKVVTHTTLYGDKLTFYADYSKMPQINGTTVTTTPSQVMASPFVNSTFDSGVYTISKGTRTLTLDFNNNQ
jgi:hypothetical protein